MPVRGRYTTIIVDQYNLSGQSNGLDLSVQSNQIDVTPFESDKQFISEPPESSLVHRGYFTGGSLGDIEKTLYDRLGAGAAYVAALFGTQITACAAYVLPATQGSEFGIQSPTTGVITINGRWNAGSGMKRGRRLHGGLVSATGAITYIDLGAAGTNGFAYLFVHDTSGTLGTATITVQSDDNTGFTTPTTHGTFSITAHGAQQMVITGTIDRYVRMNVTSLGGTTNITFTGVIVSTGVTMN